MKPIVLSLIIFLCSSILVVADSQNGRFQISAANSIAYFILDTNTVQESRSCEKKDFTNNNQTTNSFLESTMGLAIVESVDLPDADTSHLEL